MFFFSFFVSKNKGGLKFPLSDMQVRSSLMKLKHYRKMNVYHVYEVHSVLTMKKSLFESQFEDHEHTK